MSPFKLSWLELRRFRGHPIRVAALAAIVLIPLVYGGLYLWFAWDPYGELDQMPVAVVNEDTGATIDSGGETTEVNGGEQLVEQLRSDRIFDWRFTDVDEARRGLEDGDYYMTVTVPADFSADLATLSGSDPTQATIEVEVNDANGYIAGIMASTVELELQNQINTAVYVTFAKTVFGDLAELDQGLAGAAAGASELSDSLGEAHTGAADLQSGLSDLADGARDVADGADQVWAGVDQVVGVAQPVIADLAGNWDQIQSGSAAGSNLVGTAATDLQDVYDALCGDQAADSGACADLQGHVDEAEQINEDVQQANAFVQATDSTTLEDASGDLADLQTGARGVADGADQVATGAASAESGAGDLASGLVELQEGAGNLASGLDNAVAQIPSQNPAEDADNAEAYGSPVAVDEDNLHPAEVYGRGLAPFFIAIALWVFGLVAYLLLRPANPRALAGPLRAPLIAIGGWLPGALLGLLSALVLYAVVDIGLGLDPVHVAATVGLCLLVVLAFSAMAHLFKLAAGAAGSLLIVVLLMLQLTSAGGLYPVETTPAFFQAVHPWLPMSYVVDALRVTITGGETAHLVRAVGVLAAYLVGSLVVASLVVAGRRKWRPDSLNPPLQL